MGRPHASHDQPVAVVIDIIVSFASLYFMRTMNVQDIWAYQIPFSSNLQPTERPEMIPLSDLAPNLPSNVCCQVGGRIAVREAPKAWRLLVVGIFEVRIVFGWV